MHEVGLSILGIRKEADENVIARIEIRREERVRSLLQSDYTTGLHSGAR